MAAMAGPHVRRLISSDSVPLGGFTPGTLTLDPRRPRARLHDPWGGTLMSVPIAHGAALTVGTPQRLFNHEGIQSDGWDFAVSDEGQRVLALRFAAASSDRITILANWAATLRR
jgi:hypothetical protein